MFGLSSGKAAALFIGIALLAGHPALASESAGAAGGEPEARPDISGDPDKPRRHFRIRDAANLDKAEAIGIYQGLKRLMAGGYKSAGNPVASAYVDWRIYNDAPYRSATHGQRYVNNYANETGRAYGKYEEAGRLPVGSLLAKDSFSVTEEGEVRPGPLFIMEKMATGFNPVSGDWRYIMIMADGELFGATKGPDAERVDYCIGCHLVQEDFDHLFFVPEDYRTATE